MSDIKFIMRTTGDLDLSEYFKAVPEIMMCVDVDRNAMHTFRSSLAMAGDSACVNMEDDIILCDNFVNRVLDEISKRPNDVIQFFSMRKDDLTIGSRYINGSAFCCALCVYLPAGMSREILHFMNKWDKFDTEPTGLDTPLMSDFFKERKIKYWNVCPNLVDHKQVKSRINPRRSTKRQSLTFER